MSSKTIKSKMVMDKWNLNDLMVDIVHFPNLIEICTSPPPNDCNSLMWASQASWYAYSIYFVEFHSGENPLVHVVASACLVSLFIFCNSLN